MKSVSGRTVTRSIDCSERLHQAHFDILIDSVATGVGSKSLNSTAIVTELSTRFKLNFSHGPLPPSSTSILKQVDQLVKSVS